MICPECENCLPASLSCDRCQTLGHVCDLCGFELMSATDSLCPDCRTDLDELPADERWASNQTKASTQ